MGEVAVDGLILGLGKSGFVGLAGAFAGKDLGLGDGVVLHGDLHHGGLAVIAAVPDAVLHGLFGLFHLFAVRLNVGDGGRLSPEGNEVLSGVIGPRLQRGGINAAP